MNNNLTHTKGFRSNPYHRNTSSSSSTSTRSYFNSSEIGDSDDEFLDSEDQQFPIFRIDTPQKVEIMTIKCKDVNIKGGTLIKIVAEKIKERYEEFLNVAFECDKKAGPLVSWPNVEDRKLTLNHRDAWLKTLGGWKGMMPRTEIKGYFGYRTVNPYSGDFTSVSLLIEGASIHWPKNFRIESYKVTDELETDLTYEQINNAISFIKSRYKLTDAELANLQLDRFHSFMLAPEYILLSEGVLDTSSNRTHLFPSSWLEIDRNIKHQIIIFLDYLNAQMLGVKASALNAAPTTSLMTLQLIESGKFTYTQAFCVDNKRKFTSVEIYKNGVNFLIEGVRIHLPKNFRIGSPRIGSREVTNKQTDLTYGQINETIDFIKSSYNLTDAELADLQLDRVKGLMLVPEEYIPLPSKSKTIPSNYPVHPFPPSWRGIPIHSNYLVHPFPSSWLGIPIPSNYRVHPFPSSWLGIETKTKHQIIIFLDYLNALMFGIEASGLNTALVTSIMTLQLIKGGKFTYTQAFCANEDGGIYPYANFGDNSGTYNARNIILERKGFNPSMKDFRKNPSKSPVAIKEAIIIKQWLKFKQVIINDDFWNNQLTRIEQAIDELISDYLSLNNQLI